MRAEGPEPDRTAQPRRASFATAPFHDLMSGSRSAPFQLSDCAVLRIVSSHGHDLRLALAQFPQGVESGEKQKHQEDERVHHVRKIRDLPRMDRDDKADCTRASAARAAPQVFGHPHNRQPRHFLWCQGTLKRSPAPGGKPMALSLPATCRSAPHGWRTASPSQHSRPPDRWPSTNARLQLFGPEGEVVDRLVGETESGPQPQPCR